jgi:DNA-binding MarR family transcriptional regulator
VEAFEDILFQQLEAACSEIRQAFARYVGMSQARRQLLTLVSREGEISHAALQQQLSLDGATITRLVKQFEAQGMLNRRLDPQDNRYTLVSLTSSGQQIVTGLSVAHRAFQTRLLDGITGEEQETVVRVLKQLRTNIHTIQDENRNQEGDFS